MIDKNRFAATVDLAALNVEPIEQLSVKTSFTEADAYEIQAESMNLRYARGEKFVGLKLGFTSKAKMEQMGVHDMIWGRLTDEMLMVDGDQLDLSKFIHPRAEPEICFLVKKVFDCGFVFSVVKCILCYLNFQLVPLSHQIFTYRVCVVTIYNSSLSWYFKYNFTIKTDAKL